MTRWIFPPTIDRGEVEGLARELGVARFAAELLVRRGLRTAAEAEPFLAPRLKALRDPFLLPDMAVAVKRILAAIERSERIALYGDYDVDGVTSLALLTRLL